MFKNTNTFPPLNNVYGDTTVPLSNSRPKRRLLLFFLVFPLLLATSEVYIFLQPAVYASKATVLTVAAPAIDDNVPNADPQHVNIQKQILLGQSLLEKTAEKLKRQPETAGITLDQLKVMLFADPVAETNLVQLSAEGEIPVTLQKIVNTWIDAYLDTRAGHVSANTNKATNTIRDEVSRLEQEVDVKRKQIDHFRIQHDISSVDSQDNQTHARLQGLNQSLNKALEDEIKAQAKLNTVRAALALGKAVVPENDSEILAEMTKRAQQLKEKANTIHSQYTADYIQLNPKLNLVTKELSDLERQIKDKVKMGATFALQEAENNYAAAQQAVNSIKEQMRAHKKETSEYTSQFGKFRALQEELVKLEELLQKTKQRLLEIEVKHRETSPQVDVVDWASLPIKPIRPHYLFQSLSALAASLAISLFVIWLREFLSRETETTVQTSPLVTLSGIHLYQEGLPHNKAPQTVLGMPQRSEQLSHNPVNFLPNAPTRALTSKELQKLFHVADQRTTEVLCLLLNGLSADEITQLTANSFNPKNQTIHLATRNATIAMNRLCRALLNDNTLKTWQIKPFTLEEVDGLLTCAAIDSRLHAPEQINSELIRFAYMVYLVKQGIKFSLLPKIFGSISSSRLLELGQFAPESSSASMEEINLDYPLTN